MRMVEENTKTLVGLDVGTSVGTGVVVGTGLGTADVVGNTVDPRRFNNKLVFSNQFPFDETCNGMHIRGALRRKIPPAMNQTRIIQA